MIKFVGVEYSRGATAKIIDNAGPALAPRAIQKMFPDAEWTIITPDHPQVDNIVDRFEDAYNVHKKIYPATPKEKHIFIGGDHSVNFSHFAAISDQYPNEDICLIYIDAHMDIHSPESSKREATGSPHGTNVRHLLGEGDERWLSLISKKISLKPENLFYVGIRSFEPSEKSYVDDNNIFYRTAAQLKTQSDWDNAIKSIKNRIGNKKFVVSFDFDAIDPKIFKDVWVPEEKGLTVDASKYFIHAFADAINFEFVEYAVSDDTKCANIVHDLINIIAQTFD